MRAAAFLVLLLFAGRADAQCAAWDDGFHANGTDDRVYALEVYDDGSGPALFVGGAFNFAAAVPVRGVARWDGSKWSDLGGGMNLSYPANDVTVRDFQVHDDGSGTALYACGEFVEAGGVISIGVARWDGVQWSAVGAQPFLFNGEPYSMTVFDDGSGNGPELYAAGNMAFAGGANYMGIARWDGSAWHHVGGWVDRWIHSIASYDDGTGSKLYAAGSFRISSGHAFDAIAQWDGTVWTSVGGGLDDFAEDLAVFDDGTGEKLYAGGRFGVNANPAIRRFAAWDGTSWSDPGCTLNADLAEIEPLVGPGTLSPALYLGLRGTVGAGNHVQRWLGGTCQSVGAVGMNERIDALAVFDDGGGPKLFAGGQFRRSGSERADYIASWDGTAWAPLTVGRGALISVEALGVVNVGGTGPALYADAALASNGYSSAVARLDASGWTEIGNAYGDVNAIVGYDDGQGEQLVIGGHFFTVATTPANHVASWDGTSWDRMGGGIAAGDVEALGVFDLGSGDELIVAGQFTWPGGRIASWNGSAWSSINLGFDKRVRALAIYDEGAGPRLFAGGHITRKLPLSGTNIVMHRLSRWSGTDWTEVHTNDIDLPVHALAVYDDGSGPVLVIAGEFRTAGGVVVNGIVAWDGVSWQTLSSGILLGSNWGDVYALAVFDDGSGPALYAGGWFDTAGGVPVRSLARWDGTAWSDVGGGVDGPVKSLVVHDDGLGFGPALYAGGYFYEAGGSGSLFVARWGRTTSCHVTTYCSAGVNSSGCTANLRAEGVPSASAASAFDLTVEGAEGQRSGFVFYGLAGQKATPWGAGGGFQCVRGPLQRTGARVTSGAVGQCNGTFALDWNAFLAAQPNALGNPLGAGQTVWAQGWIADPAAARGGEMSNALHFDVQP